MTYCVALKLDAGLVFMSDTRTNAGVDNISTFKKMFTWCDEGQSFVTLMTAGNLATTQAVVSLIDERVKSPTSDRPSILALPSMFHVARTFGHILKSIIAEHFEEGEKDTYFNASLIVGGQVKGEGMRLFHIYPEGNFIEAGEDTPFLQIGEMKYGRPILVRAFHPSMSFEAATKLLFVSFDSTVKANLSVGLPLDMHIYRRDSFARGTVRRVLPDDAYYHQISLGWGDALRRAFDSLPDPALGPTA